MPSDVSVVSFDDDPIASWIHPQLTTIAIPHYELGRRSVELLLGDGVNGNRAEATVDRVPMPIRYRDSVSASAPSLRSQDPFAAVRGSARLAFGRVVVSALAGEAALMNSRSLVIAFEYRGELWLSELDAFGLSQSLRR